MGHTVLDAKTADVGRAREAARRTRFNRTLAVLTPIAIYLDFKIARGEWHGLAMPHIPAMWWDYMPAIAIGVVIVAAMIIPLMIAGRSPHTLFRPEQIDTSLDDVRGLPVVTEEVVKS